MGVLGVGSGTVCDITKHACYLYDQETKEHTPFVMYQTANSVSAFTSNMAPTFVKGVKRTLPSRYPDGLMCDLETLRDAPPEMTVSGVGDLLAIFVSLPDWFLAHELGMDPGYSELAFHLMGPLDALFLEQAEGIRERRLESMAVLAKLIALGGLAMSLSHATTPMSGYEHVISHVLDLQAELSNQPLAQHGSQVALASILSCGAYQHFLSEFQPAQVNPKSCYPTTVVMHDKVLNTFAKVDPSGRAGEECWADYQIKLDGWHAHHNEFEAFLHGWQDLRGKITDLTRPPERLIKILSLINAPLSFVELVPPITKDKVQYAFLSAPFYRKRLTLGDLLVYLSWDREKLWQEVWELMKQ
jgi:glycerol-1-phosphate dehydrogenase [NAD(P)+]